MKDQNFCQSCGMPMQGNSEIRGTNADGGKNTEYCVYCFKNGVFVDNLSMEEMVRHCMPHMLAANKQMTEAQAAQMMMGFFPTLKRWQNNEIKEVFCPKAFYIALDGEGAPNTGKSYEEAINTLYMVFFALQESCKARGADFFVSPLHTLWWLENGDEFEHTPQEKWCWRNMLEVSAHVSEADLETAKTSIFDASGATLVQKVRLWEMNEGKTLQALHIGSYETLCHTVSRLHEAIEKGHYMRRGWHHDIYLNDPKTTDTAKIQTLIRLPVCREMDEPLDFLTERDAMLQAVGSSKIMTLSTADRERVSSRNMSFIIINGKFYFQTALEFRKCKDMEKK